jgi:epoxyqueuosine reductase
MKSVAWMMDVVKEVGAAQCGALSFDALRPLMSERAQARAAALCPQPAGVLVGAFPYFSGHRVGNVSLYARGLDYHLGVSRRLQRTCQRLKEQVPGHTFVSAVDASPLPERAAALLSGIGKLGNHGLVICEPYGSYVFLGAILTSYPIFYKAKPVERCVGCQNCVRACPSGALSLKDGQVVFDGSRCLSHITQTKKEPTEEERAQLREHPYIWGCDLCQLACPENHKAAISPLTDLTGQEKAAPYMSQMTPEMLEGLDEASFQEKFGNRAFAWRGLQILKRNFEIQLHKRPEMDGY